MASFMNPYSPSPAQMDHGVTTKANWSPYDNNGGTTLGVAGKDFCIIAGSMRLNSGLSILSRKQSKIAKINNHCIVAAAGFQADVKIVQKLLQARHVMYQHQHNKPMSCAAMGQLLSNTLYYRRMFPYYSFTLCGGLNDEGEGVIYGYDAVGSCEKRSYVCEGDGRNIIMPILDGQLKGTSALVLPEQSSLISLSKEETLDLVKDVFVSAGERDISTGDTVEIVIISKEGIRTEYLELKKD